MDGWTDGRLSLDGAIYRAPYGANKVHTQEQHNQSNQPVMTLLSAQSAAWVLNQSLLFLGIKSE